MMFFISRKELIKLIHEEVKKVAEEAASSMSEELEPAIGFRFIPENDEWDEYYSKEKNNGCC